MSSLIRCKVCQDIHFNECVVTVWTATVRQTDEQTDIGTDRQTDRHT